MLYNKDTQIVKHSGRERERERERGADRRDRQPGTIKWKSFFFILKGWSEKSRQTDAADKHKNKQNTHFLLGLFAYRVSHKTSKLNFFIQVVQIII